MNIFRALAVSGAVGTLAGSYKASMGPYPAYNGALVVDGHVRIKSDQGLGIHIEIAKVPAEVTEEEAAVPGAPSTITKAISRKINVAIHEGYNCATVAGIGEPYFRTKVNPYTQFSESTDITPAADATDTEKLDAKYPHLSENIFLDADRQLKRVHGRVVVVSIQGETSPLVALPIACGKIETIALMERQTDDKVPAVCEEGEGVCMRGGVTFEDVQGLRVSYNIRGLEASTGGRMAILEGRSCLNKARAKDHYFNTTNIVFGNTNAVSDPWDPALGADTKYTTDAKGRAKGEFHVFAGYDESAMRDRVLMMYNNAHLEADGVTVAKDADGVDMVEQEIACAVLEKKGSKLRANMELMPGYIGGANFDVRGNVYVKDKEMLNIDYFFDDDLEDIRITDIAIHEGTSCDLPMSKYDRLSKNDPDPWLKAGKNLRIGGENLQGSFSVYAGLDKDRIDGHVIVATNNPEGKIISCGIISTGAKISKESYPPMADADRQAESAELGESMAGFVFVKDSEILNIDHDISGLKGGRSYVLSIHTGKSCDSAAVIGNHFAGPNFHGTFPEQSPYTMAKQILANGGGATAGVYDLYVDLDRSDLRRRTVVLTDTTVEPQVEVACGRL